MQLVVLRGLLICKFAVAEQVDHSEMKQLLYCAVIARASISDPYLTARSFVMLMRQNAKSVYISEVRILFSRLCDT